MSGAVIPEPVLSVVLSASRTLVGVAARSLGSVGEETSLAQYRTLVVLASRGPQRLVDLSGMLGVAPSTAGRMSDRLVRKGFARRHRARSDRRTVVVSITVAGRAVVDEVTLRRRGFLSEILGRMTGSQQLAVADAFAVFAAVAGEIPDDMWPADDLGLAHDPGEPVPVKP